MITEKDLSSGFHSFWSELLPLLTPACVTLINRSYGSNLNGCRPVDVELGLLHSSITDCDIYAEVAFEIFRLSRIMGLPCREIIEAEGLFGSSWNAALGRIMLHRRVGSVVVPGPGTLSRKYVEEICIRYEIFISELQFQDIMISPRLNGCGVLGMCEADVSADDFLVEVKTVARNFSSRDIRQVIIYLALDSISGANRWRRAILFNPRAARYVNLDPKRVIEYVSAGRSPIDVYRSIEGLLISREFEVNSKF